MGKQRQRPMTEAGFRKIVEKICGPIADFSANKIRGTVEFRCSDVLSLKTVTALSEALGTDEINFNFGMEGEPGYSELTPSVPGQPGYIEMKWPLHKGGSNV